MSTRTQIRETVQTIVRASGAVSNSSVLLSRYDNLPTSLLPAVCIYGVREEREQISQGSGNTGRTFLHNYDVAIEIHTPPTAAKDVDERMDDLARTIEGQLGNDNTLTSNVEESHISSVEFDVEKVSEQFQGVATITLATQFFSTEA